MTGVGAGSSAITGIVLPPPVVDPFSSNVNFPATSGSTASSVSGVATRAQVPIVPGPPSVNAFGDAFATLASKPSAPAPALGSTLIAPPAAAVTTPATSATAKTSNIGVTKPDINESFANFDAVQFDSAPGKTTIFFVFSKVV